MNNNSTTIAKFMSDYHYALQACTANIPEKLKIDSPNERDPVSLVAHQFPLSRGISAGTSSLSTIAC